ncbi:MAG: type II toxin-antitoxin system Phd/YefM family antitoxin [Chloroflexi bacterium]|nr:type II toxin-antitoxin system Phd/YefM family antitoxin [Chloroflexota bacterium]
MEFPVTSAKKEFSKILRETQKGPVILTRRGQPDIVLLTYADYQQLRRFQAYQRMINLADTMQGKGLRVSKLHEESRRELEERA